MKQENFQSNHAPNEPTGGAANEPSGSAANAALTPKASPAPKSALIAMSGGVDSAAAAVLAMRDGYDCAGAIMSLYPGDTGAVTDARAAAGVLGLPFYSFDFCEQFSGLVIRRFIDAYRAGRTPNPCVDCNKHIKFGCFADKALELGRDYVITGHYARIERGADGRFLLKKGADPARDQSYVLYGLTQRQLSRAVFPLGGLTKTETRGIAREAGLENAQRRESQDICFVPDGDYAGFIERRAGETAQRGRFIGEDGEDLGVNRGVIHYTVGQRRGLGIPGPRPLYVLGIKPEDNTVVVGEKERLFSKTLEARDINLIPVDRLDSPVKARVRIRYRQTEQPATVRQTGDDTLLIEFDEPQRAITGGQAAVIYDGATVIGGGTIV